MRHVLVTGGARGIGRAIAKAFHQSGDRVIATGLGEVEVANLAAEAPEIVARRLDVRDDAAIERLTAEFPRLDVLVNCAGMILRDGREHNPAAFAEVLDVNLTGTMRICSAFRSHLAASRGCVVNLASMLSFFGGGHAPAYSASKGGVAQLTKSLAIAWAKDGVRVNAVAPGWIETAMTAPLREDASRSAAILARTPLARWGQPEDITGAVLFLCSPAAAFITGVILPVDGGYSIA